MKNDKKSVPQEIMTEYIESELLKEYPQLPVARQDEGEVKFLVVTSICVCSSFLFFNNTTLIK